jgi:hypothetical protein
MFRGFTMTTSAALNFDPIVGRWRGHRPLFVCFVFFVVNPSEMEFEEQCILKPRITQIATDVLRKRN